MPQAIIDNVDKIDNIFKKEKILRKRIKNLEMVDNQTTSQKCLKLKNIYLNKRIRKRLIKNRLSNIEEATIRYNPVNLKALSLKKKFDPTEVTLYQVVDDGRVLFEGTIEECNDYVFANL